jgi:hypothetical protein
MSTECVNNNNLIQLFIYLRVNLKAQGPITKCVRVKKKKQNTQKQNIKTRQFISLNNNNNIIIIITLAKIPVVAGGYLRNVGTREMNYGIIRAPVAPDSVI